MSQGCTSADVPLSPGTLRAAQVMSSAVDALEASLLPLPAKLVLSVGGVLAMHAWPVLVGMCSLRYTEASAPA